MAKNFTLLSSKNWSETKHNLTVFLPPLPEVQCPNFLDFRNPLGKVMKRSCLRFENFCSKNSFLANFGIGATIRIGQEILCLLYAGFLTSSRRLYCQCNDFHQKIFDKLCYDQFK